MIDALSLAEAALLNDSERMRTLAHNIANVGTIGFKREMTVLRPAFDELVTAGLQARVSQPVPYVALDLRQGAVKHTGAALDLSIEGDALFVLKGEQGEVYTRQGTFRVDEQGRLISAGGLAVQGGSGDILLASTQPRIDGEGKVWEGDVEVARLRAVRFDNPQVLSPLGEGLYAAGDAVPELVDMPGIKQGYLEAANVSAMSEMVWLIETLRHFETSQRAVRVHDAMLGSALENLGQL